MQEVFGQWYDPGAGCGTYGRTDDICKRVYALTSIYRAVAKSLWEAKGALPYALIGSIVDPAELPA